MGLFLIYFRLFKQTLQFLQQINVKKYPSSIWFWDSNPSPLENESLPITNRPGLPPIRGFYWVWVRIPWGHQFRTIWVTFV